MARQSASWLDMWMAPFEAASLMRKATETASGASDVVGKRMPLIIEAVTSPWTADFDELSLMISEKVGAMTTSSGAAARGQQRLSSAIEGQAAAFKRFTSAGWLTPMEWWDVGQRNLTITTTLMGLPGEMLAPFHKAVTGNVKRLGA